MRQKLGLRALLPVAAALALWGCTAGEFGLGARESRVEERRLDPDGTFALSNVNGRIEVATWSEPRVKIESERVGSRAALERTQVVVRGEGRRVDVETRHEGIFLFGGAATVHYRITVPERARLELRTTNGSVQVRGAAGKVRAGATNGRVEIEDARAPVEASTVNGTVSVAFREAPQDGESRLSTTNGSVTLALPEDAGGEFDARTVNGSARSDFPLERSRGLLGRHLSGTVGTSKARFELRAVNGSVRIRKQGAPAD